MPHVPWHSEGMLQRLLSLLPAVVLAVALAATGVISAGMMAPDADAVAFAQFEHAHGAVQGDLCGESRGHDHHCPFCHGLPEAALPQPGGAQSLLLPHDGWRRMRDLYRAAQARNPSHAPRAPPQRA